MTHPILHDIDAFLRRTNLSETYFGRQAANDWKLISQLRNPPVVLPFEWDMSAHSAEPIPQVASHTVFPVVDEEDWCGAFEQRHNAEGLGEPVKEADIPLQIG